MQLDLKDGSLAGQLLGLVLLREGDVDVELLAGGMADDLILEAGDEGVAAQHQRIMLRLAALKGNAVHKALEVDIDGIAVLGSALTGQQTAVAVLHAGQLGVHGAVLDSMDLFGDAQTGIVAQGDLRLDGDLDLEGSAVGLVHRDDFRLRGADDLDAGCLDSGLVLGREQIVDSVIVEDLGAVQLLDHVARSLAAAEAGHVVLFALALERRAHSVLKGLGINRKLKLDHAFFELFTRNQVHWEHSSKHSSTRYYSIRISRMP